MSLKNVVTNNIEKLLQRTSFMTLWIFVLLMFVATYYFLMEGVNIFLGDENFHIANAKKISEFFVLRNSSFDLLLKSIIGNGWYMPGATVLASIATYFFQEPSASSVRLMLGIFSFGLLSAVVSQVKSNLGEPPAKAFLILTGVNIAWISSGFTLWGEYISGLLLISACLSGVSFLLCLTRYNRVNLSALLMLTLALVTSTYFRGHGYLIFILFMTGIIIISFAVAQTYQTIFFSVGSCILSIVLFFCLINPWSTVISQTLGKRFVTTSTLSLSVTTVLGGNKNGCGGECQRLTGHQGYSVFRNAQNVAEKSGRNTYEVLDEWAAHSIKTTSLKDYLRKTNRRMKKFFSSPDYFLERFLKNSKYKFRPPSIDRLTTLLYFWSALAYFPVLFFAIRQIFRLEYKGYPYLLTVLASKACLAILFAQPLLHPSHGRYMTGFFPLLVLLTVTYLLADRTEIKQANNEFPLDPDSNKKNTAKVLFALNAVLTLPFLVYISLFGVSFFKIG